MFSDVQSAQVSHHGSVLRISSIQTMNRFGVGHILRCLHTDTARCEPPLWIHFKLHGMYTVLIMGLTDGMKSSKPCHCDCI